MNRTTTEWEVAIARSQVHRHWSTRHVANGHSRAIVRRCIVRIRERTTNKEGST